MATEHAIFEDVNANGLPDVLEEAWGEVLKIVNIFLKNHDNFGFELVAKKSTPTLDDMLLSLRTMGAILHFVDDAKVLDGSEQRQLINAKQQIVWFERATLALKEKNQAEYLKAVDLMKNQANF